MQLRRAAYHVFESRRDVDHFIAVAFCKANAGLSGRGLDSLGRKGRFLAARPWGFDQSSSFALPLMTVVIKKPFDGNSDFVLPPLKLQSD